jgi:hypothetical protein
MIRPEYRLNMKVPRRPIFSPEGDDKARAHATADLGGFRPIPSDWAIDWQFFIDLGPDPEPKALGPVNGTIKREPQKAYKIDTNLVHPLGDLPPKSPRTRTSWRCATSNAAGPSRSLPGSRWPGRSMKSRSPTTN